VGNFKGGKNMLKKYLSKGGVFSLPLNIFIFFAQLFLVQTVYFAKCKVAPLLYKNLIRPIHKLDRLTLFPPFNFKE